MKIPAYANLVLEINLCSIAKIEYERLDIAMNPTLKRFTYLEAYGEIIHPLPDLNDINADEDVEPPILRRLLGRPRKIGGESQESNQQETRIEESSSVGACANVMNNVIENIVEIGLDATTQQSVNVVTANMNEFTSLTNDEPSEIDYVAF
nr:hypothetical protein CFP56_69904 [Quercus suber]